MELFDRSEKEQETEEEQFVAEKVEGEDINQGKRVISNPFICPFCDKKIRKVRVITVDDEDEDDVNLIGCPNCHKVIGATTY